MDGTSPYNLREKVEAAGDYNKKREQVKVESDLAKKAVAGQAGAALAIANPVLFGKLATSMLGGATLDQGVRSYTPYTS